MKLHIYTCYRELEYDIAWLEIFTPKGNFVIQEGHAPMIITLDPQKPITFRLTSGKQESHVARHGVVEIQRDSIKLCLEE